MGFWPPSIFLTFEATCKFLSYEPFRLGRVIDGLVGLRFLLVAVKDGMP